MLFICSTFIDTIDGEMNFPIKAKEEWLEVLLKDMVN